MPGSEPEVPVGEQPAAAAAAPLAVRDIGTHVTIGGVDVLTAEGAIEPEGAEFERLLHELLHGNGFFICKGVLPKEMAAEAREKMLGLNEKYLPGSQAAKRLLDIIEKDKIYSDIVAHTHERVGCLLEAVMGPRHYLGSYHALTLYQQEGATADEVTERRRGFHSDYPGHQRTAGHLDGKEPYTVQTIWMLEDFSAENGGTHVLPRSHLKHHKPGNGPDTTQEEDVAEFIADSIPATGEAGDVLVYIGQTWHTAGTNVLEQPRVAILGQWLPYYFAPMENHIAGTPPRVVREMSAEAR
eukprot:SAG22_NODE_1288_length_4868_cov_5.920109_3_plen_298_part_00